MPLLLNDPDARAVEIGIAATILIHLLFLLLAPRWLQVAPGHGTARMPARSKQFVVRVVPPPPKPPAPPPQRFVEANPNAPSNVPDKTNNFSFMNQQAAQEKPTPNHRSDTPATQGRKDVESNQIVSGSLSKPEPVAPPASVTPPEKQAAAARREENPLPGFEKDEGNNPAGFGTNVAKKSENPTDVPEPVKGQQNAPRDQTATAALPEIDPKHPRARPTLMQQHVRPAILRENPFGTDNVGPIAYDARWSSYGQYLHEMCEIIQAELDKIMENSRTYPPEGSTVIVKFRLDSKGRIVEIIDHHGTSNEQGTNASISSITNPQPYREWTEDMIAVLGHEQELTFTFFFE